MANPVPSTTQPPAVPARPTPAGATPSVDVGEGAPVVRHRGRRFYIVKDHDQPVVRSVPVGVCAAPPRVDLHGSAWTSTRAAPTCPAPVEDPVGTPDAIAGVGVGHGLASRVHRLGSVVRHPLGGRPGR